MSVRPSVRPSVGRSVGPSVMHSSKSIKNGLLRVVNEVDSAGCSDENSDDYLGSRKGLFRFQIGSRIFAKVPT